MENNLVLMQKESDGTLSFGNYKLSEKSKLSDYEYKGDLYKVKTFCEVTKLERNGLFVYESVPGSTVTGFSTDNGQITFYVESSEDIQITMELESEKEYKVSVDSVNIGKIKTNVGGKLVFSVELEEGKKSLIRIEQQ